MSRQTKALIIGIFAIIVICFIWLVFPIIALSEEEWTEVWVLCQPDSYVNARAFPKKTAEETGYLYPGDKLYTNGKVKNGFMYCEGIASEAGYGWVYKGFLVYSEPIPDGHVYPIDAKGRVACRRYINGTRRCWAHDNNPVTVYMISDEWCLTNKGFIKTEFIDLTTRLDISEPTDPADMTWEDDAV